jgi:hypothetical protein
MENVRQNDNPAELTASQLMAKLWGLTRSYWVYYISLSIVILIASFIPTIWAESMRRLFHAAATGGMKQLQNAALLLGGVYAVEEAGIESTLR